MNQKLNILILCLLLPGMSSAFKAGTYSVGLGYYSQNIMNKTAQKITGKSNFWGETSYPLNFKYDFAAFSDWFISPQLSHTFQPRESAGDATRITMTHLAFLFGKNFQGSDFDWYVGPGILQQEMKGKGGSTQLLNGSTPTTFYLPSRTVTTRKLSVNIGSSYLLWGSRLGLDLIFENAFSSEKRAQSLMLSYAYSFGGGAGGGRSGSGRSRSKGGMF